MATHVTGFLVAESVASPNTRGPWPNPNDAKAQDDVGSLWSPAALYFGVDNRTDYLVVRSPSSAYPFGAGPAEIRVHVRFKVTGGAGCLRYRARLFLRSATEEDVAPVLESDVTDVDGWRHQVHRFAVVDFGGAVDAAEVVRSDFGAGFCFEWDNGCIWGTGGPSSGEGTFGDPVPESTGGGVDRIWMELTDELPGTDQSLGQAEGIPSDEALGTGALALPPAFVSQASSVPSGESIEVGGAVAYGDTLVGDPDPIASGESVPAGGNAWRLGDLFQTDAIATGEAVSGAGQITLPPHILYAPEIPTEESVPAGWIVTGALEVGPSVGIASGEALGVGAVQRLGGRAKRPLLRLLPPFDQLTPEELEGSSGVHADAFVAFNEGVPHWRLERHAPAVAVALGVDEAELRAAVRRAKNEIVGRPATPNADLAGPTRFGGMRGQ